MGAVNGDRAAGNEIHPIAQVRVGPCEIRDRRRARVVGRGGNLARGDLLLSLIHIWRFPAGGFLSCSRRAGVECNR